MAAIVLIAMTFSRVICLHIHLVVLNIVDAFEFLVNIVVMSSRDRLDHRL